MGEIVPFRKKSRAEDLNSLLKEVVEVGKKDFLLALENGLVSLNGNFEDLLKSRMGNVILSERLKPDILRCALYVSRMMAEAVSSVPESYYGLDYLEKFEKDGSLNDLKKGADLCCFVSIFFDAREKRRAMRKGDFSRMGIFLYSLHYLKSGRPIFWLMSRNYEKTVMIAKKAVSGL